jgi:subtilisin family serine protease
VDHVYETALRGFAATIPPQAAARLARDPRIAYYEPDGIARAIGRPIATGKQVNDPPPQQMDWGVKRVCATTASDLCPPPAGDRTAWVIDTGIDLNHPDLNVDVGRSVSFVRKRTTPDDGNGHGTHVAGIIAAKNNEAYTVGVAAGATVVAVRVLDNGGSGLWSWVIAGVDYVAKNAASTDVANMSLGGSYILSVNTAVEEAAKICPFTVAAGNESDDAANYSPASASTSHKDSVYTISAIDSSGVFAWFSNWGNPPVDFAAPGVSILSLWKGGGTKTLSGTSMAAPHVAGLLLLGPVGSNGTAIGDPDDSADPIAHH